MNDRQRNNEQADNPVNNPEDYSLLGHILKTGLPPGVEPNELKDPGKPAPGEKPVDDNS